MAQSRQLKTSNHYSKQGGSNPRLEQSTSRRDPMFVVQKDNGVIPHVLTQILDTCVNGVTLTDPDLEDSPIVYANKAFEDICGYPQEEIVGRNCRFLQGTDRNQPELDKLRAAIKKGEPIEITLRNYRKNGELFYNRLNVKPLLDDKGRVVYFLGVQYDITDQVNFQEEINDLSSKLAVATGQTPSTQATQAKKPFWQFW
jgi:PAS domain S-box-containing protein